MKIEERTLKTIKKEIEEPKHNYIEKFSRVVETKRGLIIRIPKEVQDFFKINKNYKIRFYTEMIEPREDIKLIIELIKNVE